LRPFPEPSHSSGMAGTGQAAPAKAPAIQWMSAQIVQDFETIAPASDKDKFEYMARRAPVNMGTSTVYFRAMEGTKTLGHQAELSARQKILISGPSEETVWRILYNTVHAVAYERQPPEVPYSPWAGMRLVDVMPYVPVLLDYETLVHTLSRQTSTRSIMPPGKFASCTISTYRTRS
jgi:hypothetical protein